MTSHPNSFETFEILTIHRNALRGAEYNPRKISDDARKKLKKAIKQHGMVMPIVWNRRTGNVVGGHQRLGILDDLNRSTDYELTVAGIDVPEEDEVKINIVLNNPSVQGEWDNDLLVALKEVLPDIDFMHDLGFDKLDLEYIFASTDNFDQVSEIFSETKEQKKALADIAAIKQAKKDHREKVRVDNENGTTHQVEKDDYYLTFVFNTNSEKHAFMKRIYKPSSEKFLKASVLYDIANGKFPEKA
jgi:hypothetical protein